jgi:hypothetical protein
MRDLDEIFARLAKSPFRKRFRLGPKERGYLATKGLATVLEHARAFMDQRLAKWHGIPRGADLNAREHAHVMAVLERWLQMQTDQRLANA